MQTTQSSLSENPDRHLVPHRKYPYPGNINRLIFAFNFSTLTFARFFQCQPEEGLCENTCQILSNLY